MASPFIHRLENQTYVLGLISLFSRVRVGADEGVMGAFQLADEVFRQRTRVPGGCDPAEG